MDLLEKLNLAQKEAVINTDGPIMVMAGAGSGKTRVLTHRIAYLVKELGIPLSDILAVTFTNKAAKEMKERVAKLLDDECVTTKMWVSTIHSLCLRILKRCMDLVPPFTKNFNIADENDSKSYVKKVLKDLEINNKYSDNEIKSLISKEKNGESVSFGKNYDKQTEFDKIFSLYNEALMKDNCLDFDDLLLYTTKIFKEHKDVLEYYQNKFQYIMIDEFQDTNVIQYELIKMLAIKHQNIFIVGDQDQSIYAFRGAKVENIDRFRRDFPLTKIILLEENYRSTKGILDLANSVISKNENRIKKNLFTSSSKTTKPIFFLADSSSEEIKYIIFKMEYLKKKYNYTNSDFAIIYRANYLSRPIEDEFVKRGIKYQIYGGMSYFSRAEVKDIVAYLSLIVDQNNDFAFKRIVNVPKRKIGDALMNKLVLEAIDKKCSLFQAIDSLKATGTGYNNLISFKFLILELRDLLDSSDLPSLVDAILDKSGYKDYLKAMGEDGDDRLDNVLELKSILAETEEDNEGTNLEKLSELVQSLALRTDIDKVDDNYDSVRLMTYHQSKGLEFKVVFMIAMEEGIFPSNNCKTDFDIAEERRICYVGITRAMEKLYLTSAKIRNVFGVNQRQVISRFIDVDSPLINTEKPKHDESKALNKAERITKDNSSSSFMFHVGDKIEHKAFGPGLVVSVDEPLIVVAFKAPYGIKKLNGTHPSIKKII